MSTRIIRNRPSGHSLSPFDSGLGNFFGDFWGVSPFLQDPLFDTQHGSNRYQINPAMDIREEEHRFIAQVDLPGFNPDEVSVEIEDNYLIVNGSRESVSEDNSSKYLRNERMSGSFYQKIQLPSSAELEKTECSSENGVLTIEIPKKEKSKRKNIKVKLIR